MPRDRSLRRAEPSSKGGRLEARVTPETKRLIERAANIRGTTVTDFVVASAQQSAIQTVKEFGRLSLASEAWDAFVLVLAHPPKPNARLKSAAARYKQLFATR